jgi:hypothetical protein
MAATTLAVHLCRKLLQVPHSLPVITFRRIINPRRILVLEPRQAILLMDSRCNATASLMVPVVSPRLNQPESPLNFKFASHCSHTYLISNEELCPDRRVAHRQVSCPKWNLWRTADLVYLWPSPISLLDIRRGSRVRATGLSCPSQASSFPRARTIADGTTGTSRAQVRTPQIDSYGDRRP